MAAKASARATLSAKSNALGNTVHVKASASGVPSAAVAHVQQMQPAPPVSSRGGLLWRLLQTSVKQRTPLLVSMETKLRAALPQVMASHPLRLSHLGFRTTEELISHLVAGIEAMETGATSTAEFTRGLKGWRWNVAGRLLFERLVKNHPALDAFFRACAADYFRRVNTDGGRTLVAVVDGLENQRRVSPTFRAPEKVMEFKLRGADGVVRSYTDFGFVARNADGLWGALLIEIKMPAALAGVAAQFSEFLPRLREAQEIVAVIVDRNGAVREERILPANFVLLEHERGQIAVAPISLKQAGKLQAGGPVLPSDVAKVVEFAPASSETHELRYYKVRVLVFREWLVDIVRAMTD